MTHKQEKSCFQRGFEVFFVKKKMLKWSQKVKLIKKISEV